MTQEDILMLKTLIESNVANAVRMTVNGKIDKLSEKLDGHIEQHAEDRKSMQPVIDAFNQWAGWKRSTMSLLLPIAGFTGFGASIAVIWEFIKMK